MIGLDSCILKIQGKKEIPSAVLTKELPGGFKVSKKIQFETRMMARLVVAVFCF